MGAEILIVGGYGEVGRRVASQLDAQFGDRIVVGGRNPDRASDRRAKRIDVDDPASVDAALDGVGVVMACVLQRARVRESGVWLAEQVLDPAVFLARIAARGLVPTVG